MARARDLLEKESRRIASLWKLLRRALVPGLSRSSLKGLFKLVLIENLGRVASLISGNKENLQLFD